MLDLREVKTTRKNRNEDEKWDEGEPQVEEPVLEEEELLNRCRKARSEDELSKAMDALVENVRQGRSLSLVAKESIVRNVLLEIPYRLNKDKMDLVFDGCGILTTMSAVANLIKQLSTELVLPSSVTSSSTAKQSTTKPTTDQSSPAQPTLQIPSVLQACFATIYRMLLLVPTSSELSSSSSISIMSPASTSQAVLLVEDLRTENVATFVQMILLFPQIISNACHKWKLHPPAWAAAAQYLPKLVTTAFIVAKKGKAPDQTKDSRNLNPLIIEVGNTPKKHHANDERDNSRENSSYLYCSTLLKNMLRTLKGDHVAKGLKHQHPCGNELVRVLLPNFSGRVDDDGDSDDDDSVGYEARLDGNYMDTMLTTREFTSLVVSILQLHVASSQNDKRSLNATATTPAAQSCLEVLKASTREHREALVQSVALSGKFDPRIGPIFVRLLYNSNYLYPHLCEIAEHWSQWTFVHEMEQEKTQRYVTNLILEGLKLLVQEEDGDNKNSRDPSRDELTSSLLQGVTHRLESAFPPIRMDGMMVGQELAKRLGEKLQFDELMEAFGTEAGSEGVGTLSQEDTNDSKVAPKSRRESDKVHKIAPDVVYESNHEGRYDLDDANKSHDDQSVTWNDDLVPYDLDDPEEDLVETERPYHLLEALELIRTVESEEHAYSNHETGLKYFPELIQSRPDNLPDVAVSLLLSLLKMENKFNIENFLEMRQKAITCLVIQEPRLVGETMIEELFKDSGLSDRLNILVALQDAAYVLSGSQSLVNKETKPMQRQLQDGTPKISKKRLTSLELKKQEQLIRIEEKTRRKRSRPTPLAVVQNRFTAIAPMWFYSMLQKFIDNNENESLWRDSSGSHFLASFFRVLAAIVEFSGMHSAQVLGKDLFDLVWTFRDADVAEVRISVLVATATSFATIPVDRLLALFMDHDILAISLALNAISENDPDSGCRTIAQTIKQSLNEVSNRSVILN
ncbi:unnamed protein product [Cylindrotheca closterium]|uniref:Telomere length regulation protein conserved domain-containing protein n=1 Tax=Cylindrotheca closterium TaxID=2856 RepID=A0AAD2JI85_9STRA|nr:unnamed protein product [Cylindrotheca closterium]